MKREIKFRGWENIMKVMCEVKKIDYPNHGVQLRGMENGTNFKYVELMQFTGLKDRNGKEIYEGDICRFGSGRIKEIEYKDGGFGFQPDKEWRTEFVSFSGHNEFKILMEHIEVIGNIYETPKLLNDFM